MYEEDKESLPPFVHTWQQLYGLVIVCLVVTIVLFYWFGKYFS